MICIHDPGNSVPLQLGKAYRVLKPEKLDPDYVLRIVDDEGEDYLYDARWFVPVQLPAKARQALATVR